MLADIKRSFSSAPEDAFPLPVYVFGTRISDVTNTYDRRYVATIIVWFPETGYLVSDRDTTSTI